jgi:ABC-type amino acid transport system permease subunit
MIVNLLIGLPNDRPGGLVLTVILFAAAAAGAVFGGLLYAAMCVLFPRASLILQAATALLRGVPLLLLLFFIAQTSALRVALAGLLALILYSFSHASEILRSFVASYPAHVAQQARAMGIGLLREWVQLRIPWALGRSLGALGTHWISLLKDTGALVILGVGELTTVAKVLSETTASYDRWVTVLLSAAGVYLIATLGLIRGLRVLESRPSMVGASSQRGAGRA